MSSTESTTSTTATTTTTVRNHLSAIKLTLGLPVRILVPLKDCHNGKLHCNVNFMLPTYSGPLPKYLQLQFGVDTADDEQTKLPFVLTNDFDSNKIDDDDSVLVKIDPDNRNMILEWQQFYHIFRCQIDFPWAKFLRIDNDLTINRKPTLKKRLMPGPGVVGFFRIVFDVQIDELPKPTLFNQSLIAILSKPNPELLQDWLFCHNHGPVSVMTKPLKIEPVILNRFEQLIHILLNESDKILLEFAGDKKLNFYVELVSRNVAGCFNFIFLNVKTRLEMRKILFVKYTWLCENKCNEPAKRFLRLCRMSFEIDWYRIDYKLYRELLCGMANSQIPVGNELIADLNISKETTEDDPSSAVKFHYVFWEDFTCNTDRNVHTASASTVAETEPEVINKTKPDN